MIIDSFPYFNEKELLELRINLLKDYVDKFIIIDANRTHQGKVKPFTCKNTIKELGLDCDKIQVVELDLSWADNETNCWLREKAQRNEVYKYIHDDDYCIISDCDEIIRPDLIQNAISVVSSDDEVILLLPMYHLLYQANMLSPSDWYVGYMAKGSTIKKVTASYYRHKISWGGGKHAKDFDFTILHLMTVDGSLCGWHFSWMGDNIRRKIKNESFANHGDSIEDMNKTILSFTPEIGKPSLFKTTSINNLGVITSENELKEFDTSLLPKIIWDLPRVKEFLLPN